MVEEETAAGTVAQSGLFDPSLKKKKKKKDKPEGDDVAKLTDAVEQVEIPDESGEGSGSFGGLNAGNSLDAIEEQETVPVIDIQPIDFGKKKKKKKVVEFGDEDDGDVFDSTAPRDEGRRVAEALPWAGSERDYHYTELVGRAFEFLHGKNPALGEGGRKKLTLRSPQVAKEGSKRTVFLNFGEICKSLHRQPDNLLAYLSAELGTNGNIQAGGRLVVKGNFKAKGFENVLRKYIAEYVTCSSCRSPDTVLMRDANTRLFFLQCENCGANRSVAPIRQGYMAQVERRKRK